MTANETSSTGRRSLLALLLAGTTTAAVTLTATPAEAEPDDTIDGGTP